VSAQSWSELLADLKSRGLTVAPELAIGDGALGFWKALAEEFCTTRHQRCWLHKTLNVLNKLPKSVQPAARADLQEVWVAENRADAEKAFNRFLAKYRAKYDKATESLAKDRKALLAFYDFPAEHWKHIRTSNPIESTVSTVRHCTTRSKGCLSHATAIIMVFKLIHTAQGSWRRLNGQNQLPKLIAGVKFADVIEVKQKRAAA
jgi:putative transposase